MTCIDAACQVHDDCLEACQLDDGYFGSCGALCNCALAAAAIKCALGGWLMNHDNKTLPIVSIPKCALETGMVAAAFGPICGLTSLTGTVSLVLIKPVIKFLKKLNPYGIPLQYAMV